MGFFDIFKKKQDSAAADIPESRQQQQEELNAGLEKTKTGIFSKLARAVAGRSTVDADLLDDVEEVLITSDVGVETTVKIIRRIEERVARDKYMNTSELQSILREEVMSLMEESHGSEKHFGLDARQGEPYVVMVVGVNGAGKTTTIGKLAAQLTKAGLKVWIGAADTFRAAAIDQLKVWADRAGATMIRQEMGSDPASVAFDTLTSAKANGADVVVAVGGDGTVRTVASAMSGTGHAMGIIPIGTGNLFARNMGIPIDDIDAALTVATSHGSRHVDVGRLSLLDDPKADHGHAFLIIAGVGFDAAMIDDTDPQLKKNISWLAYFVGGVKNLFTPKYRGDVTITSTDGSMHTRHGVAFRTFMAGNCGQIPVFSLMPNASYDDGILDFEIIDTSGGIFGWANLFGDVVHQTITGKPGSNPLSTNSTMDQIQGVSAEITLEKPVLAQVDGDMLGRTRHLRFTVDREALCVRVPEVAPDMSATGIIPPIRD